MTQRIWPDPFVGGALCLDYINTVDYPAPSKPRERLSDYSMVLRWSAARGSLPDYTVEKLARRAERDPHGALLAWRNCITLRETLRDLVQNLLGGGGRSSALAALNARISLLPPLAALTPARGRSRFVFEVPGRDLNEPTWPILWSAGGMLTSEDVSRLGLCQAPPCRYVFIDSSRNRSRLWCADACGNRARVRRHHERAEMPRHRPPVRHRSTRP